MGWLDKIGPFRKGGAAVAEAPEDGFGVGSGEAIGPLLMCLVTDASGTASYKRHVFSDVESATDFVLYWFPNQNEGGIISFWAMTYKPASGFDSAVETVAEPLVMIRDHARDDLVYLFSFSDIETASAFLREEVRHGVDLGAMMLYWAVPVRMAADPWGKMILTPSVAPGMAGYDEPVAQHPDMWTPPTDAPVFEEPQASTVDDSRAIFEEAPNAHTGVAEAVVPGMETFELTSWVEKPRAAPAKDSKAAAQVREWLAEREVAAAVEPPAETRREPSAKTKDTAAKVRDWLARQEVPAEEPAVDTRREPSAKAKDTAAKVREWLAQREVAAEEPTPNVEPAIVVEAVAETKPVEPEPVEAQIVVAEAVEAVVEAEPEPVVVTEPITQAEVEEEAAVEIIAAEAVEALVEPEPEVAADPEPIAASPEETPVQASTPERASEPEVQRATIRVHTNGNGHGRQFTDGRESQEHYVSPEEGDAGVHENGNGHDETAQSQAYVRPEVEYTNGSGDHPESSVDIRIEIHLDSSRALKVKRWEAKEEPFDGFNSPPGRF